MIKRINYSFVILALLLLLVPGGGCSNAPTPTPSGKITFVSDREGTPYIYAMNPDGSNPVKLGSWFGIPNTFHWSPDSERLAFIDGDGWLCVVDADGGSLSKLAEIPSYSILWSPDGSKIAAGRLDYEIFLIDTATGKLQNLTSTPDIKEWWPVWSPDGSQIAFIVYNPPCCEITIMDADGNNQTMITSEQGICEELIWSLDGKNVCYTWYSEDEQGPEGICRDICLVDVQDRSKVNLTNSPKFDDSDLSWSPGDTRIVFSSRRQIVNIQIYVMNVDGSKVRKLTAGDSSNYLPSWSPDGNKIIFTSSGPHPTGKDICIMNNDGTNVINLTNTPDIDDYLAIWSPQ